MFALLATYFTGVDRATFDADLDEKSHAILLRDAAGALRGFSTLLVYETCAAGLDATVIYSGDTIVDRDWWGSAALPLSWLAATRALTASAGARDVYWLLLTSGFRTYRFLPTFFRDFHPRAGASPASAAVLDALARERFADRYEADRGVVRFARPQVLVPELLDVPSGRAHDVHVAFFLERNPGFVRGDELVCLAKVTEDNLTAAGLRVARRLDAKAGGTV
jgi:hypothetical protein